MDRQASAAKVSPVPEAGSPHKRRPTSITSRLRWSYLISSTVPLVLVGVLLIVVLLRVQQRNAYASQQAIADRIAGNVSTFLYDLEQQLLRTARDLRPDEPGEALMNASRRLVNSSPDLRAVVVVDASGAQVAALTSDLLTSLNRPAAPFDRELIAVAASIGQGRRTDVVRGDDGTPYFQIVLPIRDPQTSELRGAISAEVSTSRISQILRLAVQRDDKVAYLINSDRQLMLSDRAGDWKPPRDLSILFVDGQTVGEYLGGDGQQMVGARTTVSPITPTSWSVVVEQPASEFFTEVYRSLFLLTAIVLLVGVLNLIWALWQARRIVNPIQALTEGAQELGAGALDHRIIVDTGDEIGQLADTFNSMAERLQGSLREIARQNERLRHGLVLARDIQQGLLPSTPPWQTEILSVSARSLPASEVGGDFYTYLALPGGQAAIAIGDISGKGVAAALLMALTSSTLESQARIVDHPSAMLYALHNALRPRLMANQMNAALMIAVYEPEERRMTVANAGMIAPLLVRRQADGSMECCFIEATGLPIGTMLNALYSDVQVTLEPGDTLIFLSDGIVEAHNDQNELFGFERLEVLVAGLADTLSVAEVVQQILDAVLRFAGDAEPHDDITIIVTRPAIGTSAGNAEQNAFLYSKTAGAL